MAESAHEPCAQVGVLLVHGIGDHKEGETLTSFGEPLIDWMREWLRGRSDEAGAASVRVSEARLHATRTEAESPAYAHVTIRAPIKARDESVEETWLFSEAWWGDSVQPPVALKLLKWLWSRGPLLIFWHFFLRTGLTDSSTPEEITRTDSLRAGVAVLLAASCQAVVAIALVLWLIPIGRWRKGVAAAVRTLTLTLGDSYVLLENDIQRAALIERVRQSLAWLTSRCARVAVIAHSQGGAIAYEALASSDRQKVDAFVSVGSGLEKLQFLRCVRELQKGVVLAPLVAPVLACGLSIAAYGLSSGGARWQVGLGGLTVVAGAGIATIMVELLRRYRALLDQEAKSLQLTRQNGVVVWTDIASTHDLVPVVAGSLITGQSFVRGIVTTNERSYLNDHTGYFQNRSNVLGLMWQSLDGLSRLRLFDRGDVEVLTRYSRQHVWYARVLTATRWMTAAAVAICVGRFWHQMVNFGKAVISRGTGSPLETLLKPVKATAGVLSWVAQLVWAPRDQISDVYAQALVGILVLAIGLVAWLVIFKAAWRAGAAAHWRRARFALDGLATRGSRVRSFGWCGVLLVFGGLPLLVVVILVAAPGVLSPRSVAEAISVALAVAFMVPPIAVAVTAPAFWDYAAALDPNDDRDFVLVGRLLAPLTFIFSIWVFLKIGTALWPYTTPTATAAIATGVWLVHAVSWQVFSIRRLQSTLARFAIAVIPPAGTLVWTLRPSATVNGWSVLFVYNVVAIACSPLAVYAHDPAVLRDGLKAAGRVIGRSLLDSMWWRTIRTAWDRISNRSPGRGTLSR